MTRALIKPHDLCSRIHLCSPLKSTKQNTDNIDSVLQQQSLHFNNKMAVTAYNNDRNYLTKKRSVATKKSNYSNAVLKIVQFNDAHLDPYYKEVL